MVCKNAGYEVVNKLTGSYVPFPLCQAGAGGGGAGAAACRKSGRRARSLQLERFFSYRACSCSPPLRAGYPASLSRAHASRGRCRFIMQIQATCLCSINATHTRIIHTHTHKRFAFTCTGYRRADISAANTPALAGESSQTESETAASLLCSLFHTLTARGSVLVLQSGRRGWA